ncbi:MAG TPA: WYL domain-containing protein [Vicinamibacterales bacterium]|nr:WYL domain-containing protein [Vicinamibacterales bacterium]
MKHPVMWFEVLGKDAGKLCQFYGALFGWSFGGDPSTYGLVQSNGRGIPGGVGVSYPGTREWVTLYVETPDITASLAYVEHLGGRVVMPRTVMPGVTRAPATRFAARSRRSSRKISRRSSPRRGCSCRRQSARENRRCVGARARSVDRAPQARAVLRKRRRRWHDADRASAGDLFGGRTWTLAVWCELRQDFRNFRLDRIAASTMLDETFEDEAGKALRDMLARYGPEALRLIEN